MTRGNMSGDTALDAKGLSKYPPASLRELLFLSLPLILGLFSTSFMGFCDRLFLARYSMNAWQGSVAASNLILLFQHPLLRVVMMTQVFVGLYYGSRKYEQIGPAVWQMIWMSLFSMILTLPLSKIAAPFFFEGTTVQMEANLYFSTMMLVNFLFPLGTALSVFFIGQGRMNIIFFATLLSQIVNIGLDYLLIFGMEGFFPPLGAFGAALATGIAQLIFCLLLFSQFLKKRERELFATGDCSFKWSPFWKQFQTGLPRAIGRLIILIAWGGISRFMTVKGGDFLRVLSVGSTLTLLFTFINDGMHQGLVTIASNLVGKRDYARLWKLVRSSLLMLGIMTSVLAIPYLIFPEYTLSFFFSEALSPQSLQILKRSCISLWVFFFFYGYNAIGLSLIMATQDMKFYLSVIWVTLVTSFAPVYFGMNYLNWPPDVVWHVISFDGLFFGSLFLLRTTTGKWRQKVERLSLFTK